MTIQIEFWALLSGIGGMILAFISCVFGFAKILGFQLEKRLEEKFSVQRELIKQYTEQGERTSSQIQALERDFLEWKADLPVHYVRREDYIRGQSVIEAKLDALYNKIEVVQLKGASHG